MPNCDPYSKWTGGSLGWCSRNSKKTEHFKKAEANWSPVSQPSAEWQGGMKVVKGAWTVYYNLWHLAILPKFLLSILSLQKSHVSLSCVSATAPSTHLTSHAKNTQRESLNEQMCPHAYHYLLPMEKKCTTEVQPVCVLIHIEFFFPSISDNFF